MGTFLSAVRNGRIASPLRRDFDIAAWLESSKPSEGVDLSDLKLTLSGALFDRKLKFIWEKFGSLQLQKHSGEKLRQAYVGLANRDFATLKGHIQRQQDEFAKREVRYLEELLSSKSVKALNGFDYSADDLATSGVDGLHMPLRKTFEERKDSSAKLHLDQVALAVALGQLHSFVTTVWEDCVWCDWEFASHNEQMIVVPANPERARARAVGNARSVALASLMTQHGFNIWRHMSDSERAAIAYSRPAVRVTGSGKRMKLRPLPSEIDPHAPLQSFVLRIIASELYFRGLFESQLPNLPGVTVGLLLSSWEIFYSLGETLASELPRESTITNVADLWQFSPRIPRGQLAHLLCDVLRINFDLANRIVDFLTFSRVHPDELWARPFVELDRTMVVPVFTSLLNPNPLRMVEKWMKYGGLKLQERGGAFEAEARQELADAVKKSRLLKNGGVCSHAYRVKGHGENPGDIDLIIWFGNTILLGEAKCQLFPAKASEFFNYFSDLEKAGAQILRKAAAFQNVVEEFWVRVAKRKAPSDTKIVPFILTNLPLGVGLRFGGVPATDALILERFVGEGFLERFVTFDATAGHSAGEKLEFYQTIEEAEARIADYLANPPQLIHFRDAVKPILNPLPRIEEKDIAWGIMDYSVEMVGERLNTFRSAIPAGDPSALPRQAVTS